MRRSDFGFAPRSSYERQRKPSYAPRHYDRWFADDVAELRRRKADGQTRAEIAAEMGRTFKSVKRMLSR